MTAAEAYAFKATDGEVDIASGGWIMSGASKVPVGQPLCEGHIWLMGEQYWFSCQIKTRTKAIFQRGFSGLHLIRKMCFGEVFLY